MAVELSWRDDAALIVLNRPDALNALSDVRVVLVTGAGDKAFCAGADIKELRNRDPMSQKRGAEKGQAVFAKLNELAIPSLAVINGFAFGGGLELAMACTFRIATPAAKMGLPEIKLGLIPGYGGTQRLPRLVGEARALEMIMTGRTVKADEALRIGLVNSVVEGDPVEQALAFANTFTCHSLPALQFASSAVTRALDVPVRDGLKIEADLSTLAFGMKDAEEGMAAFEEKRKPRFTDE
jgi:enoyl-CoA hydratase